MAHPAIAAALEVFGDGSDDDDEDDDECRDPAIAAAMQVRAPMARRDVCARARYQKLKKTKHTIPDHARRRIDDLNSKATRSHEQVATDARKAPKHTRSWLPGAILAVCWSVARTCLRGASRAAWRMRRRRGVKRKLCPHAADPNQRSTSSIAEDREASKTYIQALRDAVCDVALQHQSRCLHELPAQPLESAVLEVSFDETEVRVSTPHKFRFARKVKVTQTEIPIMVTHGTLSWGPGSADVPIFFPARGLAEKTAVGMLDHLSKYLVTACGGTDALAAKVSLLVLILVSDAAKANRLLAHFLSSKLSDNTAMLHTLCFMHQVSLSVGAVCGALKILGPVFCGCNLLMRSKWQASVSAALRRWVSKLRHTDADPDEADGKYARELLKLLEWDEESLNDDDLRRRSTSKGSRVDERLVLVNFMTSSFQSTRLEHRCGFGCCRGGLDESKDKLHSYIMDVLFSRYPGIPAVNRWTKLFPSLAWWTVAMHMQGLITSLWGKIYGFSAGGEREDELVQDLLEPEGDDVQRALNRARATKVWNWLRHPLTRHELMISCLVLRPCMSFMGYLFRSEAGAASHSVTALMPAGNPAARTLRHLVSMLLDLNNDFWFLYSSGGWTEAKLQLGLDNICRLVGALWWRITYRLLQYPWRLWLAVDPNENQASRALRVDRLTSACDSCLDKHFTLKVKRRIHSASDMLELDAPLARSVRRAFEKCRATNILSETRFARIASQLWVSKKGRSSAMSTVSSKNLLAEMKSQHTLAKVQWNRKHGKPDHADLEAPLVPPQRSAKACSAWHVYMAEMRSKGHDMKAISEAWKHVRADEHARLKERADKLRKEVETADGTTAQAEDPLRCFAQETPYGMGDATHPMRQSFVEQLQDAKAVAEHSSRWKQITGPLARPSVIPDVDASRPRLCGEIYGPGRCQEDFSAEERIVFSTWLKLLASLARHAQTQKSLPVYVFKNAATEMVLLSIFCLFKNPDAHCFFALELDGGGEVQVGSELLLREGGDPDYGGLSIWPEADVAVHMCRAEGPRSVLQAVYTTQRGEPFADGRAPVVLRVTSLKEVEEPQARRAAKEPDELTLALRAARRTSLGPRRRRPTAGRHAGEAGGREDEPIGEDEDGVEQGSQSGGEDVLVLDHDLEEEWGAAAEAAAAAAGGAPAGVVLHAPERKPNGAIFVGDQHIGRVSAVHSGTRSRLFCYCKLHQCYKAIAFSRNPHMSGAAKWVAAGLRADVQTKAQHEALFLDMVLQP